MKLVLGLFFKMLRDVCVFVFEGLSLNLTVILEVEYKESLNLNLDMVSIRSFTLET